MSDMQEFLDNAKAFEQRMRDAETSLKQAVVTGRSGDGTVAVMASGLGRLKTVQVDPAVFEHRDPQRLATAITEAMQSAAANARRLAEQRMGPVEINLY
jgi:DNA-binding YbaB/EbfC family protein